MKQKTNSSAKKRIKTTGSGKKLTEKSSKKHLLSSKSKRQKRFGRLGVVISKGQNRVMSRMLRVSSK